MLRLRVVLPGVLICLVPVLASAQATLRVGAARVEFTQLAPTAPTPPSGRYEHEKLFVRAIVLDTGTSRAALVNVDGAAPASGRVAAAQALGAPIEHILISGTHSHSASLTGTNPGMPGGGGGGGAQAAAAASPLDAVVADAVRQAVAGLRPALMGFGTGQSHLNVNRDTINPVTRKWTQDTNLNAPSDKTVAVLKFETPAGELIALYMNYSMHPVNLYLSGIISADFPGAASRYIEQIYGDNVVAVFSQGAEGDQNPLHLRASTAAMLERGGQVYRGQPLVREEIEAEIREGRRPMVPLDRQAAEPLLRFVDAQGIMFAEEVLRVAHETRAIPFTGRLAGMQRTVTCPGRTRTNQGREGIEGTYENGPDVELLVGLVGLGPVALPWANAEVYAAIGEQVKAASPLSRTAFVGLANGRAGFGYVPTDDAFGRQTFQVLGSRLRPGCAETGIVNATQSMLLEYTGGR